MNSLILTCEHGGNQIPPEFLHLFKDEQALIQSHRGWDIGALEVALHLHHTLHLPLFYSTTSRLLVELNRSLHHPNLFSSIIKNSLTINQRKEILRKYYSPYRQQVEDNIRDTIKKNNLCLHLSIHSFTPFLNNQIRNCEVGILFDPKQPIEKAFAIQLKSFLVQNKSIRVRFNYPYKGTSDGFTTYLRKQFSPQSYAGLELELNQNWISNLDFVKSSISRALSLTLHNFTP